MCLESTPEKQMCAFSNSNSNSNSNNSSNNHRHHPRLRSLRSPPNNNIKRFWCVIYIEISIAFYVYSRVRVKGANPEK